MPQKENLPSVSPQETKEVPLEYDSNVGFKNDAQYSETEFAILWDAMLRGVDPNIEVNTDDNQNFVITTFGMVVGGYACTLGGDVSFNLSNETDPFIYLWGKLNLDTEQLTFIFDITGDDLTANDTDREKNRYLGKFSKLSEKLYFWNKEVDTGIGSRLDALLKPDVIENTAGWKAGDKIKLPKPLNQYRKIIVHGLDQKLQVNIIIDGLLPERWVNSSSARAFGEWSDGKTLHSYNVLLTRPTGFAEDEARLQNSNAWRHNTIAGKPHTKAFDFKINKIELYSY